MSERAIFLDRDDTLIEDPGYISSPEQVKLLDGVAEALIELKALGYKLVVVTNQSAVARGIVTEKVLGEIHNHLKQLLSEKGAFLDEIYYCPFHPEGVVAKYRKESKLRKPNPGMLLKASKEMDVDLKMSWCIGNSSRDIEAGLKAGCKTILVDPPSHQQRIEPLQPRPDCKAVNLKEAVNIIKKYHRSPSKVTVEMSPAPVKEVEPVSEETEQNAEVEIKETSPQVTEQTQENAEEVSQVVEKEEPDEEPEEEPRLPSEQVMEGSRTEQLLGDIIKQLKRMQRTNMFDEFSIMRLLAGVVQVLVLFCLLITIWSLISPNRQDSSVFIALGFAIVLQLMSLTFYIMHGRR